METKIAIIIRLARYMLSKGFMFLLTNNVCCVLKCIFLISYSSGDSKVSTPTVINAKVTLGQTNKLCLKMLQLVASVRHSIHKIVFMY